MYRILRRAKIELGHYRKLDISARRLLNSYLVFTASFPLVTIFTDAYIWRETSELSMVALLTLTRYATLSIGFYLNGLALKRIGITKLYTLGMLAYLLSMFLIIFAGEIDMSVIILSGVIRGTGSAFFWANRNTLMHMLTNKTTRTYFLGIQESVGLLIGLTVPLISGWLIVAGERLGLYTINEGYRAIFVLTTIIMAVSSYLIRDLRDVKVNIKKLLIKRVSRRWNYARAMNYLRGFTDVVMGFLPTIAVLIFIGTEEILGTVESAMTLLSAMVLYFVARKSNDEKRLNLYMLGASLIIIGALSFSISFSALGLIIMMAGYMIGEPISWIPLNGILLDTIDDEMEGREDISNYTLVLDREISLNTGRVSALATFFLMLSMAGEASTLRYAPVVVSMALLVNLYPINKILRST